MITLVLKDLLLQKKILTTMFIYVFIFSFAFRSLGEYQPVAIITGVSYMLVMFAGAWEDKNNADRLWNSLPVSKWQIVGSKYCLYWPTLPGFRHLDHHDSAPW